MAGDFMTAQEIYENFVNGAGPGSLVEGAMQISGIEATSKDITPFAVRVSMTHGEGFALTA